MAFDPYRAPRSDVAGSGATAWDSLASLPPPHGKRWLASFLDNLFIMVPAMMLMFGIVALAVVVEGDRGEPGLLVDAAGLMVQLVFVFGQMLYGAVFESSGWHATPGKRLMGLQVVGEDGQFLSFGKAFGRNAAKSIGLSMCGLIAISVLADDQHRGLWDRVASTRVVSRNPYA